MNNTCPGARIASTPDPARPYSSPKKFTMPGWIVSAGIFLNLGICIQEVQAAPVPIRINCAGPAFTATNGVAFSADQYFIGGVTGQNQSIADIAGTANDTLYRTERIPSAALGTFQYEFPVANGNYIVVLHEAEIWYGATGGPANSNVAGKRLFNLNIEGARVLSNYDIIAEVGTMTAVTKRFNTTVSDGSLSLAFSASVDKPKCSAIEILAAPTPSAGAIPIPGKIEAENFDNGGQGSAYHDLDVANQGGQYRTGEGVDIVAATDSGAGYKIAYTKAGEWLSYTVNVAQAGTYTGTVRVASLGAGGTFHIEFDGVNKTGPITVPDTGGWQNWQTITFNNVSLAAGQQTMRIVMDTNGPVTGEPGNINWVNFAATGSGPSPYAGVIQIPGQLEAENFDLGGEGVGYHDLDVTNQGAAYRLSEGVDIVAATDTGGGYKLAYTKAGEWLSYSVNVAQTGTYSASIRVASSGAGGTFHLEFNGVNKTGAITVPNTGGWQNWQTITVNNLSLSAGPQTMRIVMDTNGPVTAEPGNINWINFTAGGGGTGLLRWKPPTLTLPVTINLGTGATSNTLDNNTDYIVNFPTQKKNGHTILNGGRNIRIIGGYATAVPGNSERILYLQNQQGTVHIEGMLFDNSGGREADAIAIQAPNAIVQIQNVRAVNLIGGQNGHNHSDVVQPWGGVKELRIDRLSGSSNYQGLFLRRDLGPIGSFTIQNTNLWYQTVSGGVNDGGYMLWLDDCSLIVPTTLTNVYVVPKSTLSLGKSVWPDVQNGSCPAQFANNQITWPSLPKISGAVKLGPPPAGDYVPAGTVGLNYVSPGYQ